MTLTVGNPFDNSGLRSAPGVLLITRVWAGCMAVRMMTTSLGPLRSSDHVCLTSHHANRPIVIEGDPLPVRLRRSRAIKVTK
jgi:hypothetical protein